MKTNSSTKFGLENKFGLIRVKVPNSYHNEHQSLPLRHEVAGSEDSDRKHFQI